MDTTSAKKLWNHFLEKHTEFTSQNFPSTGYFGDNETDANILVNLVSNNVKRATSHSLLGLQLRKEAIPKIGDFFIVTDWKNNAKCIVRTIAVKLVPFFSINEEHARIEGEGDKSLAYWKKVHWDYYTRELEPFTRTPKESMIVVFEQFELVHKE